MEPTPEFSRVILVADIPQSGLARTIAPTPAEAEALAKRFGIAAIHRFEAQIRLQPQGPHLIAVSGQIEAAVSQYCVLSNQIVADEPVDSFETSFTTDPAAREPTPDEIEADPDLLDAPEPVVDGRIDIGELAAQYLSLALDPHPVAPGESWPEDGVGDKPESPFAVLLGKAGKTE